MKLHVLIKRYTDNSGFYVIGATEDDAVAQAFCAGGRDGAAKSESYLVDTEAALHLVPSSVEATKWE